MIVAVLGKRLGFLCSLRFRWEKTVGTMTRTVVEKSGQMGLSIQCSRLRMKAVAARVCLGF